MPKEEIFIRVIQAAIVLNTVLLFLAIWFAKQGKIQLHIRLGTWVVISTMLGVLALAATVTMGWDYPSVLNVSKTEMLIHRSFSVPLFFLLPLQGYLGWKRKGNLHRKLSPVTLLFWMGTLITGLWFF